ncbi:MAG: hypothetical protein DHS20C17_32860 [Cyclobacteriaceae bacterium]|nr:MAG: hypothetical protein DHS20C17_32860 [Cyclobacteriaceae bacterium]
MFASYFSFYPLNESVTIILNERLDKSNASLKRREMKTLSYTKVRDLGDK